MSGVLMEYREAFRMYPIYKDFQEKARSDESQNKKLNEVRTIRFTKSAQKLQKYITSQIEKYLDEMSKL